MLKVILAPIKLKLMGFGSPYHCFENLHINQTLSLPIYMKILKVASVKLVRQLRSLLECSIYL